MRHFISALLFFFGQAAFIALGQAPTQTANDYIRPYTEDFQYGTNLGYYNSNWPDVNLAGIAQTLGAHSIRPSLPEYFLEQYGYSVRATTFSAYVNSLGMKELTCFVEGPSPAHREQVTYPGATEQSKMFAHLYEPIWNYDGTVNQNNYYAYYLYQLLQIYGDKVRFWEVVNEPDFSFSSNIDQWKTRPPAPGEMVNIQAPIFSYIRMLHVSYEVIKKYHPEAYVTTGGVGYSQFVDALMRYTENPNGGAVTAQYPNTGGAYLDALSFHSYPAYSLHFWDTSINAFRYTRTSDYAVQKVLQDKQDMVDVMTRYGYNGVTHPAKYLLMSETNISRRTSDDRTGSDEQQRNFGIKTLVLAQKHDIKQLYYYQLGESVNAPAANQSVSGNDELALMGLYENLLRDAPGSQKTTQLGQAFATTSKLLYGAQYDAARTAGLALPAGIDGAAFRKNGSYLYVLWAKALVDNVESAYATYSFPASWGLGSLQRAEWNYSTSNAVSSQWYTGISLSTTPSFFSETTITNTPTTTAPTTPTASTCPGTGSLLREQWTNVAGSNISDIPQATTPSASAALTQFEAPDQYGNSYAARLRGYVCAPQTGSYIFWIAGDDQAELYLSTDEDPTKKRRIASSNGWLASAHDFTRYPSQQSAAVRLVAGQKYYIEALHKQGWGPGYVAVAWQTPAGTRQEPIPGSSLIPFGTPAVTAPTTPTTSTPTTAPTTPAATLGSKARVTVTFASAPASATASVAPLLYNKTRVLQFEEDDSPLSLYTDVFRVLKGGVASNGQRYPGLRFTDGCGNNRAYTAAAAINGHNPYNNVVWLDPGASHDPGRLTWAQLQEMLNNGWDVENHSDLHTSANPAQQVATLDALITDRLNGYRASVMAVPANFAGYSTAAFAAGYVASSSGSQGDNLPMLNLYTDTRIGLSTLPAPTTPFVYKRYNADLNTGNGETTQGQLARLNALSDALMAAGSPSTERYMQRVFTHGLDLNVLAGWMTYTQSIAQDRLWVTTLREFAEYRRLATQVTKTEQLNGNTLTIDLDYGGVSANTRFQNLTLLINSPGTITNITVTGADSSSYNATTKLVNIFRHEVAAGTTTPTSPTTNAPTTGCAGTGSLLREQWSNVAGSNISSIPQYTTPTSSTTLSVFEAPDQYGNSYAARLRGYICPPQTGTYTFWVAGDDQAELYLSPDADPNRKTRIASSSGWLSWARDFTRYAGQQSAPVQLVAGQRYYIEALHKQGWGPGFVAVAWQTPTGNGPELVPGSSLIPYATTANRTAAPPPAAGASASTGLGTKAELSVAPNPFTQQATVQFSVPEGGAVSLELYDLQGRLVQKLLNDTVPAGIPQTLNLNAPGLSTGVYLVRLTTPKAVVNYRVVYNSSL